MSTAETEIKSESEHVSAWLFQKETYILGVLKRWSSVDVRRKRSNMCCITKVDVAWFAFPLFILKFQTCHMKFLFPYRAIQAMTIIFSRNEGRCVFGLGVTDKIPRVT